MADYTTTIRFQASLSISKREEACKDPIVITQLQWDILVRTGHSAKDSLFGPLKVQIYTLMQTKMTQAPYHLCRT